MNAFAQGVLFQLPLCCQLPTSQLPAVPSELPGASPLREELPESSYDLSHNLIFHDHLLYEEYLMTVVLQRQSTRPVNDLPILLTEDQELPHGVPRDLSSGRIDSHFSTGLARCQQLEVPRLVSGLAHRTAAFTSWMEH